MILLESLIFVHVPLNIIQTQALMIKVIRLVLLLCALDGFDLFFHIFVF